MTTADKYQIFADAILVTHFLIVSFVVIGFACIFVGRWFSWRWIFNPIFRWAHTVIMALIAIQAVLGQLCPLTTWENALRQQAGSGVYSESFVQYWLHRLLFFDAPLWVFATIYIALAAVVILTWLHDRRRT